MAKTTFEDPEEDPRLNRLMSQIEERLLLISSMTAEDVSRQLLDSAASKLTQSPEDYGKQIAIATQYTALAQAYILAEGLRDAAKIIKGEAEDELMEELTDD